MNSYEEAYVLYNEHAFRMGFSVRKSKQRYRGGTKTLLMKRFYCSKAEEKEKVTKENKCYSKLDVRSSCKAFIQFDVDENGVWTVTRHEKEYNHELCGSSKTHILRSHRRVTKN